MLQRNATFNVTFVHRLRCTRDLFDPANPTLAALLEPIGEKPAGMVALIDAGVAKAHPSLIDQLTQYADANGHRFHLTAAPKVIPGGEAIKNDPQFIDDILQVIDDGRICRCSYVLAIGGGAVLDAVGFAASIAHRGVRLVRIATTTLAQADSAMGVKNSVNRLGKKNFLGAFDVPWAAINEETLLASLSERDWRAGFSEAVKVALLKDADLFAQIEQDAPHIIARDAPSAMAIIRRSALLHFEHITAGGDPFERGRGRPLDFGHWAAHQLEQLSDFQLPHGEAVAAGVALDVVYARLQGWLDGAVEQRVLNCLTHLGFQLDPPAMQDTDRLLEGVEAFREHLGGELTVPMIRDIAVAFDVHEMDAGCVREAVNYLTQHRPLVVNAEREKST